MRSYAISRRHLSEVRGSSYAFTALKEWKKRGERQREEKTHECRREGEKEDRERGKERAPGARVYK
jgi:hypothetical protein